jgi:UDP-N-acetyl-D-mannosaminuronate dehydrogenase
MADCAIFLTKHNEYTMLTLEHIAKLMRHKVLIDGRNIFDEHKAKEMGIEYRGVGKG